MEFLPDELLLQIFEIVSTQNWEKKGLYSTDYLRRTRNLHRLSLVSRKFNRIVTPLLYERIVSPIFLSDPFWRRIAETVHQHADLAQLVKQFQMTKSGPTYHNSPPLSLRSELPIALLSELHSYDGVSPEKALLDLEHRSKRTDYIFMVFLVLQASTLEELDLTGFDPISGYRYTTRLPLIIEEMGIRIYRDIDAGHSLQCFQYLRSLQIDLWEWGYFPADAVIPFLHLPRLKSLMLEGWGYQTKRRKKSGFTLFGARRSWPVRSSCIEDLSFECNNATPKQVERLLTSVTALRKIEISASQPGHDRLKGMHMTIFRSLIDHAESLETIIVEDFVLPVGFYPSAFKQVPFLKSLRLLQIPYCSILGDELTGDITTYLPSSLEYLVVGFTEDYKTSMDFEMNIGRLSEAIRHACIRRSLPCLKAVEITLHWDRPGHEPIFQFPDVRKIVSNLKDRQVIFGLSMIVIYHNSKPPTVETMRVLKDLFPGIHTWCKGHKVLRLSTSTKPCVPGYKPNTFWRPYGWVWKPWDFENDPMPVDE